MIKENTVLVTAVRTIWILNLRQLHTPDKTYVEFPLIREVKEKCMQMLKFANIGFLHVQACLGRLKFVKVKKFSPWEFRICHFYISTAVQIIFS
jgi:hypothetical protein